MKKTFLIITLFLYAILTNAQNKSNNNGGIKGGYNLAAVSFDGEGKTSQRHGFHIGVYGESFLGESVSLQPELLYSQQGFEIENSFGKFTQKVNYINLPLMLKIYPVKNLFFEIGPQVGLTIYHKEEYEGLFSSSKEFVPDNFDYGVNFGTGIKTDSGVSLSVRYHLGLGDIYNSEKAQNRVWLFSLGFDLK